MQFEIGSASQSVDVQIVDDAGIPVTGLVAATFPAVTYGRMGAFGTNTITLTDLDDQESPWEEGGVFERDNGYYRLDIPNEIFNEVSNWSVRGESTDKRLVCPPIEVTLLGQIESQTSLITAEGIVSVRETTKNGGSFTILTGAAYTSALGNARVFDITDVDFDWTTASSVALRVNNQAGITLFTKASASVTSLGSNTYRVVVELTSTQTSKIEPTKVHPFSLDVTFGGNTEPKATGTILGRRWGGP